jgi:hypothetical protein
MRIPIGAACYIVMAGMLGTSDDTNAMSAR